MIRSNRYLVLLGMLAAALLVAAIWSGWRLIRVRTVAIRATEDLQVSMSLARQITNHRQRPSSAVSEELQITELTRRLEDAAKRAQLPADALVRIAPEAAHRVGDSVMKEKPTQILLRHTTLRQLAAFLQTLTTGDSGLHVKRLRLTAPRDRETSDEWTVEATLSYLIYAPPSGSTSIDKAP